MVVGEVFIALEVTCEVVGTFTTGTLVILVVDVFGTVNSLLPFVVVMVFPVATAFSSFF